MPTPGVTRKPVGLVIFDCDGVLVDSEPLAMRVLLETVRAAGATIDAASAYEHFLGRSLASVSQILRTDYGVHLEAGSLDAMRAKLYQLFRMELKPIPGVVKALGALTTPFCVASSSQMERIRLALEVTGLARFFGQRLYSASMVAQGKPAPDLFLHAARQMGVDPMRVVVVEDSPAGVHAATRAGMRVLAFTGATHARSTAYHKRLEALKPALIFDDMLRLVELVRDLEEGRKVS
jgi:HAD superfamily hydrolase (TIGR01509 family)